MKDAYKDRYAVTVIDFPRDFTMSPGGRYRKSGPFSAEEFRDNHLLPALRESEGGIVRVILDGTYGMPPSFCEEAFGGAVRNSEFTADELLNRLELVSEERSDLVPRIRRFITNMREETAMERAEFRRIQDAARLARQGV